MSIVTIGYRDNDKFRTIITRVRVPIPALTIGAHFALKSLCFANLASKCKRKYFYLKVPISYIDKVFYVNEKENPVIKRLDFREDEPEYDLRNLKENEFVVLFPKGKIFKGCGHLDVRVSYNDTADMVINIVKRKLEKVNR